MYKNTRPNVTTDRYGVHYPEDTAHSHTTLHCNRSDPIWKRKWVIEQKIPVEARHEWHVHNRAQWKEFHQAEKACTNARRVILFTAWYMGKGKWAWDALVADGKLVSCDFISPDAPVLNGICRRFGTYRQPMAVFKSADDVKYYVRTMCK